MPVGAGVVAGWGVRAVRLLGLADVALLPAFLVGAVLAVAVLARGFLVVGSLAAFFLAEAAGFLSAFLSDESKRSGCMVIVWFVIGVFGIWRCVRGWCQGRCLGECLGQAFG